MGRTIRYIGTVLLCVLAATIYASPALAKGNTSTAATKQQISALKKQERKNLGAIRFWHNPARKHVLHLNQMDKPCWEVKNRTSSLRLCMTARTSVRTSRKQLAAVRHRINRLAVLLMPVGNVDHWMCIHNEEGAWTNPGLTWDGRPSKYYGGLQMDITFQRTHGLDFYLQKGTANNWTPREQMVVAERAKRGIYTSLRNERVVLWQGKARGYHPWPNTARECGLLS